MEKRLIKSEDGIRIRTKDEIKYGQDRKWQYLE